MRSNPTTCPTGVQGSTPDRKQTFGLVDVAGAGDGALVEQGGADGPVGVGAEAAEGLDRVPVGAEDVGAEVADDPTYCTQKLILARRSQRRRLGTTS